jgi:CubicO group peptidase (beta-lactamase class C family)
MNKTSRWITFSVLFVILIGLVTLVFSYREYVVLLHLASAFKAKSLCAGIFVQGLPVKTIEREDCGFNSAFKIIFPRVNNKKKIVTCSLLGTGLFSQKAIYIEGLGPVLLCGTSEKKLHAIAPNMLPFVQIADNNFEWPHGDKSSVSQRSLIFSKSNVDFVKLDSAVDLPFTENDVGGLKRTRAVLVIYDGCIVAERYAPGITKDTRLLSWSMAKSFTNALTGVLVNQGKLDIRTPALVPEWKKPGDPRGAITVDMLLRMSSGLSFYEEYADHPVSDVNRMLFLEPDAAKYAESKLLAFVPDTKWSYSSGTTNIVCRIIRNIIGNDTEYLTFPYQELFNKIGMQNAVWGVDASGTLLGSSYIYATGRDYARFGLLCLNDGVWNGERILPEGWITYSTTPTRGAPKGEYGAFFWLNRGKNDQLNKREYPDMPDDLYWADGYQGQEIFICPSLKLVAVRLGVTWDGDWGSADFLTALKAAITRS